MASAKMDDVACEIAFVILHYNAMEDTIECIDSIRNTHKNKHYHIVLVDNASPNGSGKTLMDRYSGVSDITVLLNDANLGFARGNNVGFKYAKDHLAPKYIVLLNNDTIIEQPDFLDLINEEYQMSHFAVLGPVIKTPNNINNFNPLARKEKSIPYLLYFYAKCATYYCINMLRVGSLVEMAKKKFLGKKTTGDGSYQTHREEDVMLHGCFLIFSDQYISRFDGLHDGTFLYLEEDLLYNRIHKSGLKSVYTPKIQIFHKEDASTKTIVHKGPRFQMFFYGHHLHSIGVLLRERLKDHNSH